MAVVRNGFTEAGNLIKLSKITERVSWTEEFWHEIVIRERR